MADISVKVKKKTAHFNFSCEFFQSYKYTRTSKVSKNNSICQYFCEILLLFVTIISKVADM